MPNEAQQAFLKLERLLDESVIDEPIIEDAVQEALEELGRHICRGEHIWILDHCMYLGHAFCRIPGCNADPNHNRWSVEAACPNGLRTRGKERWDAD